ncbi:MAG: hypothetical protein D5R96_05940 [Methanocalculus sp. MSAO_Arc2]|uniref:hypothetical protein n=1 Tax=Methanocalculus sp. MSAO_Arc2 TaxID=2293855 RepID=UPI000FF389F2|nr:MAG: hypothetical protein D5R96_05940 [Methanocalculus sp. MSAO_Arc2]
MPKLQHVRIVNAQFDDGKGVYEDFIMPFYGRNATYELRNGGGKSVLLMLMLQCLLPNTSLDTNHPFKDMFRGGDQNRTTHVLAEWELEEGIAEKKYLLTGFCAKRRSDQDEGEKNDGIKYFTYIHLYDGPNDLDLEKIHLCWREKGDFVVRDYTDTQKMLREKAKAGNDIWITDVKKEYIEKIKTYCLLEPEWEFIKQINKQENFLKSYFRDFRSSRTLVEKLLIKTIEKCLQHKQSLRTGEEFEGSNEKSLADALYQCQEQLTRLQEEQKSLHDYEHLMDGITTLQGFNQELIGSFQAFEEAKQRASSQYVAHQKALEHKEEEIRNLKEKILTKETELKSIETEIERIRLIIKTVEVNNLRNDLKIAEEEKRRLHEAMKAQEYEVKCAWAINKYLKCRDLQAEIRKNEEYIENITRDHTVVFTRLQRVGKTLLIHSLREKQRFTEDLKRGKKDEDALKEANKQLERALGSITTRIEENSRAIASLQEHITELEEKEADLRKKQKECPRVDAGLSEHVPTLIEATEKRITQEKGACDSLFAEIDETKRRLAGNEASEKGLREQIELRGIEIDRVKRELDTYAHEEYIARQIAGLYGMDNFVACSAHLNDRINELEESLRNQKDRRISLERELEGILHYGVALNRDTQEALDILPEKYKEVTSGAKYLKNLSLNEREEKLAIAPWLSKAILFLPRDYEAIVKNPSSIPANVQDAQIIITSYDHLRENRHLTLGDIYIPSRPPEYTLRILDSDREAEQLRKSIDGITEESVRVEEELSGVRKNQDTLSMFLLRFPTTYRERKETEIRGYEEARNEKIARHAEVLNAIEDDRNILPERQANLERKRVDVNLFDRKRLMLIEIQEITQKKQSVLSDLQKKIQYGKECETELEKIDARIAKGELDLKKKEESNRQLNGHLQTVTEACEKYREHERDGIEPLPDTDLSQLTADYFAAKETVDGVIKDIGHVREMIARDRSEADGAIADIRNYQVSIAEIEDRNPHERIPKEVIQELEDGVEALRGPLERAKKRFETAETEYRYQTHDLEKEEERFNREADEPYLRDPDLLYASPFIVELDRQHDIRVLTRDEITALNSADKEAEKERSNLETHYRNYEMLDGVYRFAGRISPPAGDLIPYTVLRQELASNDQRVKKSRKNLEISINKVIEDLSGVTVAFEFVNEIRRKLRAAENLDDAYSTRQSLDESAGMIRSHIAITREMVEGLREAETKIVAQALGIARQYRDYLKKFPAASKIEIDGRTYEMLHINFETCEYSSEMAEGTMQQYIQNLTRQIQTGGMGREELEKALMPDQLVGRVLDMGQIIVKIRKIDIASHPLQEWERIKASDGQENTMYIIFLVVIMSAIREIVLDRYDMKTAKVLIVDNPFGSTGAHYLWEKIRSILERNNVQIICSGHNIGADVREFFQVNHILTEETSASGRTRIGIRFTGAGMELHRVERQRREDITGWV